MLGLRYFPFGPKRFTFWASSSQNYPDFADGIYSAGSCASAYYLYIYAVDIYKADADLSTWLPKIHG